MFNSDAGIFKSNPYHMDHVCRSELSELNKIDSILAVNNDEQIHI